MCALIICCCYDTEENGRSEYTEKTLQSLRTTVDWKSGNHRLVIVDNNSCEKTKKIINNFCLVPKYVGEYEIVKPTIITLLENVGTARGINMGLRMRLPGEAAVKIDNDVVIHQSGWVDEMEEVLRRDPTIGIVGLKRKDVDFNGTYIPLPHQPGERWVAVEGGGQIMGTCTMFNPALIDKIGGMRQIGVYGMDDCLYDLRSQLAGFWNCYLPHIDISHIDTGENPYTQVKHQQAAESWHEYTQLHEAYKNGTRPLWEDFA